MPEKIGCTGAQVLELVTNLPFLFVFRFDRMQLWTMVGLLVVLQVASFIANTEANIFGKSRAESNG
jgi:hypothetical protein